MNLIKKMLIGAVALASVASAEVIWLAGDGETSSLGTYWYVAAENDDGKGLDAYGVTCDGTFYGSSTFPDELGEGGTLAFTDCIGTSGSIDVGLNVAKGSTAEYPWGFSLVGIDLASPKADVSISGISVDLSISGDCGKIGVVAKNSADAANGNASYYYDVRSGATDIALGSMDYPAWADPATYTVANDGVEAIHIKFENTNGQCDVSVKCVGTAAGDCTGTPVSTIDAVNSSINYSLTAAQLSFSEVVNAEVFDMQGRVVAGATSVSSLDLSNLSQGSYIVKAANENGSMINKISILD